MSDHHNLLLNERVKKLALAYARKLRDAGATDEEIVKALRRELVVGKSSPGVTGLIQEAIDKADRRVRIGDHLSGAGTLDPADVLGVARKGAAERDAIQKRTSAIREGTRPTRKSESKDGIGIAKSLLSRPIGSSVGTYQGADGEYH